MKVDFKIRTWERIIVPEELEDVVLEKLKSGEFDTTNEIFEFIEANGHSAQWEIIPECEEYISTDQNDGYATIEALTDDGVNVFKNGW